MHDESKLYSREFSRSSNLEVIIVRLFKNYTNLSLQVTC